MLGLYMLSPAYCGIHICDENLDLCLSTLHAVLLLIFQAGFRQVSGWFQAGFRLVSGRFQEIAGKSQENRRKIAGKSQENRRKIAVKSQQAYMQAYHTFHRYISGDGEGLLCCCVHCTV